MKCDYCGEVMRVIKTPHITLGGRPAIFRGCFNCKLIQQELPISLEEYYEGFLTGVVGMKSYQMLFFEKMSYSGLLDKIIQFHYEGGANRCSAIYVIGCGLGIMLDEAAKKGFTRFEGNDINLYSINYAKSKGHKVYHCPTHKLPNQLNHKVSPWLELPENDFDIVTMKSYLAHSPFPYTEILLAHRMLKENGVLFIREAMLGKPKNLQHEELELDHLTFLNEQLLIKMLMSAGFTVPKTVSIKPRRKCYDSKVDIYARKNARPGS